MRGFPGYGLRVHVFRFPVSWFRDSRWLFGFGITWFRVSGSGFKFSRCRFGGSHFEVRGFVLLGFVISCFGFGLLVVRGLG